VYHCPCGVGQATCSEGSLDIASNSGLEGDRVTDRCGTARLGLGGQVCPREVWLHVQRVSCDDGRLDPAQDPDLSERKRLCSAHGPANGSWLYDDTFNSFITPLSADTLVEVTCTCVKFLCKFMQVPLQTTKFTRFTRFHRDSCPR